MVLTGGLALNFTTLKSLPKFCFHLFGNFSHFFTSPECSIPTPPPSHLGLSLCTTTLPNLHSLFQTTKISSGPTTARLLPNSGVRGHFFFLPPLLHCTSFHQMKSSSVYGLRGKDHILGESTLVAQSWSSSFDTLLIPVLHRTNPGCDYS